MLPESFTAPGLKLPRRDFSPLWQDDFQKITVSTGQINIRVLFITSSTMVKNSGILVLSKEKEIVCVVLSFLGLLSHLCLYPFREEH